jgi:hypothetical protein
VTGLPFTVIDTLTGMRFSSWMVEWSVMPG